MFVNSGLLKLWYIYSMDVHIIYLNKRIDCKAVGKLCLHF